MATFNSSRLVLARQRRGLTKTALHNLTGIPQRSLTAYEAGDHQPGPLAVVKFVNALGFPEEFFYADDLENIPLSATSFRALSKMTAQQQHQAISAGTLATLLADWIDERFDLPAPDIPQLREGDPETAAEVVRGEWGLGERAIRNMVHLLEARGIRVFSLVEECHEVDAFSTWRNGVPYVFLNTMKSAERSRMDAAHELGHLVMHWHHDVPRGREAEDEAKAFASAFLMPEGSVKANAPYGGNLQQITRAKRHWDVATTALVYRMHKVGMLSDWEYRSLFKQMSKRGDKTSENAGLEERETSQLLPKVFKALRDEGITKADVARDLALPVEELNKLVFGLILTQVDGGEVETTPATGSLRLATRDGSPIAPTPPS